MLDFPVYTKNILEPEWNVFSKNNFTSASICEESLLPYCFSLDKTKSNENTYVFHGFFPNKKGLLSETSLFIDTITFHFVKLITQNQHQTQNVLYQYEAKL